VRQAGVETSLCVSPSSGSPAPWRWVGTLFFAEGLPATLVMTVSAVLFNRLGVGNEDVALYTAGLGLPWILKPLWSPLLEAFGSKRVFVAVSEGMIALGLLGIAAGLAIESRVSVTLVLLALIALCAATHDIAADGLYLCTLPPDLQVRYVGWLSVAFQAARLTAQGLLVVLAGTLETRAGVIGAWQVVFVLFAAMSAGLAFHHWRVLPREDVARWPQSLSDLALTSADVVTSFFKRKELAWLLGLVVFYRLAEGQLVRIVPLFLLESRDRGGLGLSTTELGTFYGGFGVCAFISGALAGGWIAEKVGLRRSLMGLCLAFNLPALAYVVLSHTPPASLAVISAAIAAEQFVYGLGTVGLKLIMMRSVAQGRYRTSHFAFAAGLSGLSATGAGMASGWLQARLGYPGFFSFTLLAAIPALLTAYGCSRRAYRGPERRYSVG
jgi:MFS transporter, PAT family, beta-lactamase induction signal transducer AmpG